MPNWFRRNGREPEPTRSDPAVHHGAAHVVLPAVFRMQPLTALAALASPERDAFLSFILREASPDRPPGFSAADFRVHCARIADLPAAVVEFPPPEKRTHVYFVALLADIPEDGDVPTEESEIPTRYITLEKTKPVPGIEVPETVLGEWVDGGHANFGEGGPATLENFLQRVKELVVAKSDRDP